MNLFLKAKHWQLFLLLLIPIAISSGVMMYRYVDFVRQLSLVAHQAAEDISFDYSKLMEASMWMTLCGLFSFLIYALWVWAVNMNLNSKLSPSLRDSKTRFAIVFIIPILYMAMISFTMYYLFADIINEASSMHEFSSDSTFGEEFMAKGKILLPINLSLYILTIPSVLYLAYRTGKTLKKLEQKTEVKLGECMVEVILVLFFPVVGVWFLQPKVNRYASFEDWDESQTPPPSPPL